MSERASLPSKANSGWRHLSAGNYQEDTVRRVHIPWQRNSRHRMALEKEVKKKQTMNVVVFILNIDHAHLNWCLYSVG